MSGLEELPPEILRRVCVYALPQGLKFSFRQRHTEQGGELTWDILAEEGDSGRVKVSSRRRPCQRSLCKSNGSGTACRHDNIIHELHIALLQVSKKIAAEARSVFFGGNVFRFMIGAKAHHPVSLKSPLIFGPLGLPHRLHLLRDIRQLELTILIDDDSEWSFRRQHARIQHFVDIIRQHADDEKKKSLLRQLHIEFRLHKSFVTVRYPAKTPQIFEATTKERILILEPLASISGIEDASFTYSGTLNWFVECILLRLRGEGGELNKLIWPMRTIKRIKPRGQLKRPGNDIVSSWSSGMPTLDWFEFARRNGIEGAPGPKFIFPKRYGPGMGGR